MVETQIWAHRGFDGGRVTAVPSHTLDPDQSPDAENFDPSFWFGLKKRGGTTSFTGTHGSPTGTKVRGLIWVTFENGTIKGIAKEGTAVYDITAGNWATTITGHPALSDADEVHFTIFKNVVIMTSEEASPIAPQKWTGSGSWAALGGSPPAAKYCCVHKGRLVLAATNTDPSRVYWSGNANHELWSPAGADDATNMFIHPGDGMVINGIASDGHYLYVSKQAPNSTEGAIYAIAGDGPATFKAPVKIAHFGAANQRAMAFTHSAVVIAGRMGVWGLRVGEPMIKMSHSISPDIENLTAAQVATLAVGPYKDQVWVSHDIGGGVSKTEVVDTFFQRWSRYSLQPVHIWAKHPDGSMYGASDTSTIRVMKFNDGVTDLGSAITMYWKTMNIDFGAWFRSKRNVRNLYHTKDQAITWSVTRFVNDVLQTGTDTFVANTDPPVHRIPGRGTDKWGRFLSYRIEESSSTLLGELYGLEAEAEMRGATQADN